MAVEASSESYARTMFGCMPLRLGVFFTAILTFLISLLYLLDRPLFQQLFQPCVGGYTLTSSLAVGFIEASGVLFGLLGIFGAWDSKRQYILTYNLWQYVRLATWAFMFYIDAPLLLQCEGWVDNVKKSTAEHGWNQLMYDVAVRGGCPAERTRFFTLGTLTLIFFMYVVSSTGRYLDLLDRAPKQVSCDPKDLTSGIFYAKPHGDRRTLDGFDSEGYIAEEEYGTFDAERNLKDAFSVSLPQSPESAAYYTQPTMSHP